MTIQLNNPTQSRSKKTISMIVMHVSNGGSFTDLQIDFTFIPTPSQIEKCKSEILGYFNEVEQA